MAEAAGSANRFGPYFVQEKLGGGGMSVVYKALNEQTGATVALKILRASLAENPSVIDRFKQEASIANRLRHPHIVTVNSFGSLKNRYYLELQYFPGGTLAQRFRNPIEMGHQEAVRLLRQVASALDYAHQMGVIHRDIKLENILLDRRGDAALADFGIARIADGTRLTATGSVIGTPLYLSPEQARGEPDLDHRSDLYSLAIIAYVLSVGHFPFNGSNPLAILNKHVSEPVTPPSQLNPVLPHTVDAVLLKGLAKRREERYRSADAFVEAYSRAFSQHDTRNTIIDLWSDPVGKRLAAMEGTAPPAETADELYQQAAATRDRREAIDLLKRALEVEPLHSNANRLLFQLEGAKLLNKGEATLPAREPVNPDDLAPLKKVQRQSKRGGWFYIALFGFILISVSSAFFVLSVLGLPVAGQIAALLGGGGQPVLEIGGTPVESIPGVVLTVQPRFSKRINRSDTLSDVLDAGVSHEYIYNANTGQEITIGLWFVSGTAQQVGKNVAILGPDGLSAEHLCQRDRLILDAGDTNVSFVCHVDRGGDWRIRVFGIAGESTGAYFVRVENL